MPDQRYRPRGWHLDPDDPTSVRYWDGQCWQHVRNRPAWSLATGEMVVDVDGRLQTTNPWADPPVEGPGRPTAERAATGVVGLGAETRRSNRQPPALRSPAATHGARAGQFPALGASNHPSFRTPWEGPRRPLAVFGLIVIVAIVAMVATIGWSRSRAVGLHPLPSSFVAEASRTCAAALVSPRPAAVPTTAATITAQDSKLDALAGQLRGQAMTTAAGPSVDHWLSFWQRYTADEGQRAALLDTTPPAPAPAASGAAIVAPGPSVLGGEAVTAAGQADSFATANDLQSCTIMAHPTGAGAIPS